MFVRSSVYQRMYNRNPKRQREGDKIFEEIMAENFPNLIKCMDPHIQEVKLQQDKLEIHTQTHN